MQKRRSSEQILALVRQVQADVEAGLSLERALRKEGIGGRKRGQGTEKEGRKRGHFYLTQSIRVYLCDFYAPCAHLLIELRGYSESGWNAAMIEL
jgi:hypothetical protein